MGFPALNSKPIAVPSEGLSAAFLEVLSPGLGIEFSGRLITGAGGDEERGEEEEGGEQQKTTQQLVLVSASVGRRPQQWGTLVPPACGKHFVCCFVYEDSLKYFPAAVVTPYCSCQQFFEGLLGHSSLLLPRIAIWQACSSASPQ